MKWLYQPKQKVDNNRKPNTLSYNIHTNLQQVKDELQSCADLVIRELELGGVKKVALIHMQGISNSDSISENVVNPLLEKWKNTNMEKMSDSVLLDELKKNTFNVSNVKTETKWTEVMLAVLTGDTAIFLDECSEVLLIDTKGGQFRSITESTEQAIIRGPKDSFTESIATNMSLIRNRIRNSHLKMEIEKVGDISHTNLVITYLDNRVDKDILEEVKRKIKDIKTSGVLESLYIEGFIESKTFSPFPTILNTDRPDVVTADILEGRIGILVDGTPTALVLPATFLMFFQSPEDYYQRYVVGSFLRLLRIFSYVISLLGTAFYIALITHHQAMIPTSLLYSFASQRESVPFPAILEAFLMEFAFEILREGAARTPKIISGIVTVVGALVLGQAVVQAGFVSTAMVIVVSISAVAGFTLPYYSMSASTRLIRFAFIISAGFAGLFGIALLFLFLLIHTCSLHSFGVPYLTPLSPFSLKDQEDTFVRFPRKFLDAFSIPQVSQNEKSTKNSGENNETNS